MDPTAKELIPFLDKGGIGYQRHGTRLRVALPNNFGALEIGNLTNGDTLVSLVGEDWHSHSDTLKYEGDGISEAEAVFLLIDRIFRGEYLLIEELENGKSTRRTVVEDPELFYRFLPDGVDIKIYNEKHIE